MSIGLAPSQTLLNMVNGAWVAQSLAVAAGLGIADALRDGPRSAAALAERCGAHAPSLFRLMRALASVGVFAQDAGGNFALTPLGECLRSDAADGLRDYAIMNGAEWQWRSWGELLYSVRTGKPGFDHVFGKPIFDYYSDHPEAQRVAARGLTGRSRAENAAIARAYDFSTASTVVDVGGGQGTLLAEILKANPKAHGVLFERAAVLPPAERTFEEAGLSQRSDLAAGDFFVSIPAHGDFYILKKVIHDWDDERSLAILKTCRAAMSRRARLLLIEHIVPEGDGPAYAKLIDVLMLVYAGGRERTEVEHRELLAGAGLSLSRVVPVMPGGLGIIEAVAIV